MGKKRLMHSRHVSLSFLHKGLSTFRYFPPFSRCSSKAALATTNAHTCPEITVPIFLRMLALQPWLLCQPLMARWVSPPVIHTSWVTRIFHLSTPSQSQSAEYQK